MSMYRKWTTLVYEEKQLGKIWGIPVIKQIEKMVKSGHTLIEIAIINMIYLP